MPRSWSLLLAALAAACGPAAPPADHVILGDVWTGDSARPWATAVAVRGDTIAFVGDSAEARRLVGSATTVTTVRRGVVLPGFEDGHLHLSDGGFVLASVDLRDAATPAEFVARIKAQAARVGPGQWVLGGQWDHERWPGSPLPRREWLDSVTPDNPVFVQRLDGHMAVANSAALRAAGIDRRTPDVPGGTIVRDPRTGEPTGVLKEDPAMGLVWRVVPPPSPAQADSAVARALAYLAERGVTAFTSVSVPWHELGALDRLRAAGRLTARGTLFFPLQAWRDVADTIRARGQGDRWLRLGGVKGYMDGSLGSTTALFYAPYADAPSTSGLMVTPPDSMRRWVAAADSAGLQVVVHAIGERANGDLLDLFAAVAQANGPRDRRFRVEHAQHLRPQDVPRFAALGVVPSMQPIHLTDDGRWAEKRLGPDRVRGSYVFRALLDAKAPLVFGSDWPVASADPIEGLAAAVTRRTWDGSAPGGWLPEQKITVEEALRAYTRTHAWSVFGEQGRGVIRPGMLADLVVLDRDVVRGAADSIAGTRVLHTMVGGRLVYSRSADKE